MAKELKKDFGYLGESFQKGLITQLLTDRNFANSIIDIIDPNYFNNQWLRLIVSILVDNHKEYEIVPDVASLEISLLNRIESLDEHNRVYIMEILREIKEHDLYNSLMYQDLAMKFCKIQEMQKALNRVQKIIDTGDLDTFLECESVIRKALEVGDNKDTAIDVCANIDEVLADDFRKPIPTGISGLDEIMNGGLSRQELGVILAPFGVGKSGPLSSKLLTPNGWTTMGDIKEGDEVISRDGKPTKVTGVFPQGIRPIYKVSFNDGTETRCDEEHLWAVNTINQRNRSTKKNNKKVILEPDHSFKVMKTKDMINNVKVWGNRRYNYKIPIVEPVHFNENEVKLDPYFLGCLLGDGCISSKEYIGITSLDKPLINEVSNLLPNNIIISDYNDKNNQAFGFKLIDKTKPNNLVGALESYNLIGTKSDTKFIPKEYLYNSIKNRVSLLQGLIDTDGYIDGFRVEYSSVSKQLAYDVKELVLSLGGRATIGTKIGSYKDKNRVKVLCKEVYRVNISFPDNGIIPARLKRKVKKFKPKSKYKNNKFIISIEPDGNEEAQCIMVDNPEHLYVTDDYIVTHNTTMITKIANSAKDRGYNVLQIFFEDTEKVIQRKHFSCWSGVNLNDLSANKEMIKEIATQKVNEAGELRLKKFSSDGVTIPMIKQYIRKLIASGFRPDLILLDYIDVVSPSRRYDDANVGEGSVMREFESMLVELNMAGWTAVQGNRSSIGAELVEANQMGGSIKKGQIGHFIVSIAKTLEQKEDGTAKLGILKSRFGKDGLVLDARFDNGTVSIEILDSAVSFLQSKNKKERETIENKQEKVKDILSKYIMDNHDNQRNYENPLDILGNNNQENN